MTKNNKNIEDEILTEIYKTEIDDNFKWDLSNLNNTLLILKSYIIKYNDLEYELIKNKKLVLALERIIKDKNEEIKLLKSGK